MKNKMKLIRSQLVLLFGVIVYLLGSSGCAEDPQESIWDPNFETDPQPIIERIEPADSAYAAIDEITIYGENFSSNPEYNQVWFDKTKLELISSSTNELKVLAPFIISDNVEVKVIVQTAVMPSNEKSYKLLEGIGQYYPFSSEKGEAPYAICYDKEGNLYVSLVINDVGDGVKKITPTGEISEYAPRGQARERNWTGMKFGPDGHLYASKNNRGVFKLYEGVEVASRPWVITSNNVYDFDFDANGNMWAAGKGNNIYNINYLDSTSVDFPFECDAKAIRVFQNHLFVGGLKDDIQGVWKFNINGEEIGEGELYFDLTGYDEAGEVRAINFLQNGTMILGTDLDDPILLVTPTKEVSKLYEGNLNPMVYSFTSGHGKYLLYSRETPLDSDYNATVMKVILFEEIAPYYGITL